MLMSFSVPVFAGMLFLDLMTKSGTFRFFALAALTLVLPVSGASAGSEPDDSILNKVYEVAKPRNVPVFCNTGCRHENVREKLKYCDAVCMGTAFKKDGVFNGRVDEERVRSFMEIVYDIRARL